MLKIDKDNFSFNLNLTQQYCRLQMNKSEKDNAKIFRSINPIINKKPIFSFMLQKFDFNIKPALNYCTLTKWFIEPISMGKNKDIMSGLFEEQISAKQKLVSFDKKQSYEGDILVSLFDCTVIDGASEVESLGLIDIYDMPPIDTWFYLTKNKESRLLFAWIPKHFEHYVNDAISVNCLDLIHGFQQLFPDDYKTVMTA